MQSHAIPSAGLFTVLGQASHDMCVMMLHCQAGQSALLRVPRGEIVGMSIVNDLPGPYPEQPRQVGQGFDVPLADGKRIQIADVLPQEELVSPGEGDGRLEMPSGRQ